MRVAALVLVTTVMMACSSDRGLDGASPDTTVSGVQPETPLGTQLCATDGSFDFQVFGSGFFGFEGKRVFVAAIEPANPAPGEDASANTARRPVRMQTAVAGGSFSVACPSSLRSNSAYPSYTIVIDADDDGRCSTADIAWQAQFYAWNAAVNEDMVADHNLENLAPIGGRHGPIGSSIGYCQAYFE